MLINSSGDLSRAGVFIKSLTQNTEFFFISFSEESSIIALKFAEDINNSDFPPGSLNILSGQFENVFEDVSKHVEINLISICKEIPNEMLTKIQENASSSVKRIVNMPSVDGISSILPFLETKTVWHPKGT